MPLPCKRTAVDGGFEHREGHSYLDDDEEVIAGIALLHDDLAVFELDGLERISDGQPFPFVERF